MKFTFESSFQSNVDGVKIAYACLQLNDKSQTPNKNAIAFFTGYKECYEKYLPFLTNLHKQGSFDIYTMDHRNQGLSGDTPGMIYEKGWEDGSGKRVVNVDNFLDTYVEDMKQFLETIVKKQTYHDETKEKVEASPYESICVVTHSMGGLIAAKLAEMTGTTLFDRMALSAPMMLHKNILDVGGLFDLELPISVANAFASFMKFIKLGKVKADGRDTNASKETTELLSHSPEKIRAWNELRKMRPQIVLAGASFSWAKAALDFEKSVIENAHKIQIPTIIFMSEDDAFVYHSAIQKFVDQMNNDNKAILIGPVANSYHELLYEKDEIVIPIQNTISAFASLGKTKYVNAASEGNTIPVSLTSAMNTIPISKHGFDDKIRRPSGSHSGWKPPTWPTALILRDNPNTRYFLFTLVKGVLLTGLFRTTYNFWTRNKKN